MAITCIYLPFRITALYGLLFEHKNLNVASHDILHELFGVATAKILMHTSLITRKERLVSYEGKDIYLPGYNKRNRLDLPEFRRKMDLLNVPIMLFNGVYSLFLRPSGKLAYFETFELVKAVSDTVCIRHNKCRLTWLAFDIYPGYVSGEARLSLSGSEYKLLNTFEFIKAVSDTVLDMINTAYCDKPLIFIRATFREKLVSNHQAVNEVDLIPYIWYLWGVLAGNRGKNKGIVLHWSFGGCVT